MAEQILLKAAQESPLVLESPEPQTVFFGFGENSLIPFVIIIFRKKDGGISVVTKKRSAIGTFF
jgi:small-conductance mechanosensitive channel